jgi:hypothetical protein
MTSPALARILTLAGALPFWLGVAALLAGETWVGPVVVIYAALIASFVAGIHWGLTFGPAAGHSRTLLITSNGVTLAAWGAALLPQRPAFALLALLFAGLYLVERRLGALWPDWFARLRLLATALVVSALLILAILSV